MKSKLNIRIRTYDRPYRGKRTKAKDYKGMLPNSTPWPWQQATKSEKSEKSE